MGDYPDENGYIFLGEVYESHGGYDWGIIGVWKKGHEFFYDTDWGCSCKGPWELGVDYTRGTTQEISKIVRSFVDSYHRDNAEELIRDMEAAK